MASKNRWARSASLVLLRRALPDAGLDWPGMAMKFGFNLRELDEPEGIVTMRSTNAVFEHVATVIQNDGLLFDAFYDLPIGDYSVFDYLFICAPTILDGCKAWERYMSTRTNTVGISFTRDADGGGWLEWLHDPDDGPYTKFMFARMGWALKRIELALGQTPAPVRGHIISPPPKTPSKLQERYQDRITFNAARDAVYFSEEVLATVPVRSDDNLYSIILSQAKKESVSYSKHSSPAIRIADAIAEAMKTGSCTLDDVAQRLAMSPRDVQRTLETEGTSFREMIDEIRRSAATRYLRDTSLPMKEIAFLLGFSEISAFSRAAKNWFGRSPRSFREGTSAFD
ncbi:helix-turn-helix domain-containing protein [Roseibium sp.]|uniref:AraC family transcriptional regulator n=1 Tax=Roseibium sp. TaxID=1936156 RepID=UPI003A981AAF